VPPPLTETTQPAADRALPILDELYVPANRDEVTFDILAQRVLGGAPAIAVQLGAHLGELRTKFSLGTAHRHSLLALTLSLAGDENTRTVFELVDALFDRPDELVLLHLRLTTTRSSANVGRRGGVANRSADQGAIAGADSFRARAKAQAWQEVWRTTPRWIDLASRRVQILGSYW
jgi:hypothetical protein